MALPYYAVRLQRRRRNSVGGPAVAGDWGVEPGTPEEIDPGPLPDHSSRACRVEMGEAS